MSNLVQTAINNPISFGQQYVRTAMTVGGAVALNAFVEPIVMNYLPDMAKPYAKPIGETIKFTNILLISASM